MQDTDALSFQIIAGVGNAKSCFIQAMRMAREGDAQGAQAKIKEGEASYLEGHKAHAQLLTHQANGDQVILTMLLMHAEDQLIAAETIKILALEIIALHEQLANLKTE